jgi:hypothetical protein
MGIDLLRGIGARTEGLNGWIKDRMIDGRGGLAVWPGLAELG